MITRRISMPVTVGSLVIGGAAPIRIQSMTNTDTADVGATVQQIESLVAAGSELVRVTVNSLEAARAVPEIRMRLEASGCSVPLIGDFHFNGHRLLSEVPDCAQVLDKYRINPGNVGRGSKKEEQFAQMIEYACRYGKAVRIGVNWGSLDAELMAGCMDDNHKQPQPLSAEEVMRQVLVRSALESMNQAISWGLSADKIVLSCKVSSVQDLILVYRQLAATCHQPLHLGLTEAGMSSKGIVASTAAISVLLQEGIGDTIRVSLTPEPNGDRTLEVRVAQEILQTMGLRAFTPQVIACPGCGRTTSTYYQELAQKIQEFLRQKMLIWPAQYPGVENLQVAVMGCVVNGPGESQLADIGISLPGSGERPVAPVYIDGQRAMTLKGEHIAEEFQALVEQYVQSRYCTTNGKSV